MLDIKTIRILVNRQDQKNFKTFLDWKNDYITKNVYIHY